MKTVAIDFSQATDDDYDRLEKDISGLKVSILVNNVGMSHDKPVLFAQTPVAELESIAEINVRATLRVTRLAVPVLTANKRSLILNLGSFAGSIPTPLLATYAGTKSFLIGWNRALNEELRRAGCTSLVLNTYFVSTAMSKIRKSSWSVPTPKQYVAQVLAKLGRPGSAYQEDRKGREMTIWPQHAITEWAVREIVGLGRATSWSYGEHARQNPSCPARLGFSPADSPSSHPSLMQTLSSASASAPFAARSAFVPRPRAPSLLVRTRSLLRRAERAE